MYELIGISAQVGNAALTLVGSGFVYALLADN